MKTSLRKLRGFALHRHGDPNKDRTDLRTPPQLDHLAQASQDMEDMRDCYDSLLSAAAATANSAYEFSESLRELGACLLEKTALNDDEESGKVLLMLGKIQFELQKLVDTYRSHIFQTITVPSESLLNELQTVEEMKQQCDDKRDVYERMIATYREKGRSKGGRGENFSVQQLQAAHEEYDEEATLFVFRLKSLKQGQSRSLLTQAARHHAAQLCFFKKALKSLEIVEPHVKSITEQQHIDYYFSGLEDDDGDDGDDVEDDDDDLHDGELSFDYSQKDHQQDDVSASRNSMELDQEDITFPHVGRLENSKLDQEDITSPHVARLDASKDNLNRKYWRSFSYRGEFRPGSLSAPLFFENKSNPSEKMKQRRPSSTHKFNTYVLPTPVNTKGSYSTGKGNAVPNTLQASLSGRSKNLWHSSPLLPKKYEEMLGNEKSSQFTVKSSQSVLRESNKNTASGQLPPPLTDGLIISHLDPAVASVSKKIKIQAFSGPLMHKPWPKTVTVEHPQMFSGPLLRKPVAQKPSASPSAFPTFMSTPKISELHELPRPPSIPTSKSSRPKGLVGHSAPLMSKGQVLPQTNKLVAPNAASPLPTPSQAMTCSFSIPSSSPMETTMQVPKSVEVLRTADMAEEIPNNLDVISEPRSLLSV